MLNYGFFSPTSSTRDADDDTAERTALLDFTTLTQPSLGLVPNAEEVPSYGSLAFPVESIPNSFEETGTDFIDVEEGSHRQQQGGHGGEASPASAGDNANEEGPQQRSQNERSTDEDNEGGEPVDGAIANLTRRLRCLFSAVTWPIVPLGSIVALALLWVFYAASSLDLRKSCSQPLHSYAIVSMVLVAYIPNHARVQSRIFQYWRDRDGPIRPPRVRMYDQFFHTLCLLYVYSGVTLLQACHDDVVLDKEFINDYAKHSLLGNPAPDNLNTCQATCPNLYQAMSVYVATLELFTFALILPLLFLPCVYLWFLQRASTEAGALSQLQERYQDEAALLNNGGVTTGEILESFETIKIISRHRATEDREGSSESREFWILPSCAASNDTTPLIETRCEVKECCICMYDFDVEEEIDPEDVPSIQKNDDAKNACDVHESDNNDYDTNNSSEDDSTKEPSTSTIIRTRCGHMFHRDCIKSWVAGSTMYSSGGSRGRRRDWTKRKARKIFCPLCREDLRPHANNP